MYVGRRQADESGFTLIELLISTVILGMLGSAVAACIILFFRTADGTSRRFDYSHDSQLLATYLIPDLESLAGNSPGSPTVVSPGPGGCPTGSESFSDLQIKFTDAASRTDYVADYTVATTGLAITRTFTIGATTSPAIDVIHNLKAPGLACFSARPSAPWTMTITTGPPGAASPDDYTFSVTGGGRVTYPPPSFPVLDPNSPPPNGSDSGIKGDNITNVKTPTFKGTARPRDIVTLFENGTSVGSNAADRLGNYIIPVNRSLADDNYTITATATDASGDTSVPSVPTIVTIDTVEARPSPPALTAGGNITNDPTPSFGGTSETNTSPATVTLFANGKPVGTGTSNGGTYTATVTSPLKPDGDYTIAAETTDAAGNTSRRSMGQTVTIDTAAPTPTIISVSSNSGGTGQASGDLGTAKGDIPAAKFAIYLGSPVGSPIEGPAPVVINGVKWSANWTGLTSGTQYTIVVTQTDMAGNVGSAQQPFTQS